MTDRQIRTALLWPLILLILPFHVVYMFCWAMVLSVLDICGLLDLEGKRS